MRALALFLAVSLFAVAAQAQDKPVAPTPPTPPVAAPVAPAIPAMAAQEKKGFFSKLFEKKSDVAGPAGTPAPANAPNAGPKAFAEIKSGASIWVVNQMGGGGTTKNCSAMRNMAPVAAASGTAPATLPTVTPPPMNLNIMRMHTIPAKDAAPVPAPAMQNDVLQIMANLSVTPKSGNPFTVDGNVPKTRNVMRSMNQSVNIDIDDIDGFTKSLAGGTNVTLAMGDEKETIPAATMLSIVKKLNECVGAK